MEWWQLSEKSHILSKSFAGNELIAKKKNLDNWVNECLSILCTCPSIKIREETVFLQKSVRGWWRTDFPLWCITYVGCITAFAQWKNTKKESIFQLFYCFHLQQDIFNQQIPTWPIWKCLSNLEWARGNERICVLKMSEFAMGNRKNISKSMQTLMLRTILLPVFKKRI